jgi:YHS domain-containing protein
MCSPPGTSTEISLYNNIECGFDSLRSIGCATSQNKEAKMAIDPICLTEIDEKTTPFKSLHRGQTFYFCDETCKRKFEEEPEKYIDTDERES